MANYLSMYPIPPSEHLVENRVCRKCQVNFPITDKDMEFYVKVSPVFDGKKYLIPPPTLCPDCRQQRRLSFRNERTLYKRKCDATGKEIVSIYSPDKPYKVYHQDYWWSDAWDPMSYGRAFDFTRSAMEQMGELMRMVPNQSIGWVNNENSEYTNYLMNSIDCYMTVSGRNNEKCLYSRNIRESEIVIDSLQIIDCHNCYDIVASKSCYNVLHSFHIIECRDSINIRFCTWCEYCFGSIGLTNKKYYFFNIPFSKEEYEENIKEFQSFTKNEQKRLLEEHFLKFPRRYLNEFENEKFYGIDYTRNSKEIKQSLFISECERLSFCFEQEKSTDLYDCTMWWNNNSFCYEWLAIGSWLYNSHFFYYSIGVNDWFYFHSCFECSNIFLCAWLRNKSYCILNKQYTKEEYESLVPRIIEKMMADGEWWEFFPSTLSPFGYNETVAQEYSPLTKAEAISQEFNWSDYEAPFPKVEKIIPASRLPEDITEIPDDILNWAIECEISWKPFRIIKQELDFYRKHSLSIPKRHPDVRYMDRMTKRNPRKIFERKCDKCEKDMIMTYAPERREIVYCEECYMREIFK